MKATSKLYKARIVKPTETACESLAAAGFDGLETSASGLTQDEAKAGRLLAEKFGLRVHSVMGGGARFDSKDPEVIAKGIRSIRNSIRNAAAFGADAMLLVPGRIDKLAMPEPWDFDIDFDPKTLMVRSVAEGDNTRYADYIAAQNHATASTLKNVETLIPTAAREGVRIALENVWNNLWCTPEFFAALVRHFDSPWVGCYFDLGNHAKYSCCESWLEALAGRVVKLHIKGFKVKEFRGKRGGGPGDWVKIDQASIDWKAVRRILSDISYNGWVTTEENGYDDNEYATMLNRFFAGDL